MSVHPGEILTRSKSSRVSRIRVAGLLPDGKADALLLTPLLVLIGGQGKNRGKRAPMVRTIIRRREVKT